LFIGVSGLLKLSNVPRQNHFKSIIISKNLDLTFFVGVNPSLTNELIRENDLLQIQQILEQ
jgi:hypothetical protein